MLRITSRITPTKLYLPRYFTNFQFERSFLNIVFFASIISYTDSLLPLISILYLCKNKYVITMTVYVIRPQYTISSVTVRMTKSRNGEGSPIALSQYEVTKFPSSFSLTALNKNNK